MLQFDPLNHSQSKNGTGWIPIGPFFCNVTSVDHVMFWDRVSRATSNLNRIDWNYSRTYYSCFRENTRLSIIGSKSNYHMPSSAKFCVVSIVPVERPLVVRMSGDGFNLQYFRNQNKSTTTFILVLEEFFALHIFCHNSSMTVI